MEIGHYKRKLWQLCAPVEQRIVLPYKEDPIFYLGGCANGTNRHKNARNKFILVPSIILTQILCEYVSVRTNYPAGQKPTAQ